MSINTYLDDYEGGHALGEAVLNARVERLNFPDKCLSVGASHSYPQHQFQKSTSVVISSCDKKGVAQEIRSLKGYPS